MLWPDAVVTDASLQRAISLVRQAFGDSGEAIIQTHARRGYRFAATVTERPPTPPLQLASPTA